MLDKILYLRLMSQKDKVFRNNFKNRRKNLDVKRLKIRKRGREWKR